MDKLWVQPQGVLILHMKCFVTYAKLFICYLRMFIQILGAECKNDILRDFKNLKPSCKAEGI